jgi:hypothetical protein
MILILHTSMSVAVLLSSCVKSETVRIMLLLFRRELLQIMYGGNVAVEVLLEM